MATMMMIHGITSITICPLVKSKIYIGKDGEERYDACLAQKEYLYFNEILIGMPIVGTKDLLCFKMPKVKVFTAAC